MGSSGGKYESAFGDSKDFQDCSVQFQDGQQLWIGATEYPKWRVAGLVAVRCKTRKRSDTSTAFQLREHGAPAFAFDVTWILTPLKNQSLINEHANYIVVSLI
jgi:hypothetical protein